MRLNCLTTARHQKLHAQGAGEASEDGQVFLPLLQLLKVALELPVTFRALEGGGVKGQGQRKVKSQGWVSNLTLCGPAESPEPGDGG